MSFRFPVTVYRGEIAQILDGVSTAYAAAMQAALTLSGYYNEATQDGIAVSNLIANIEENPDSPTPAECAQMLGQYKTQLQTLRTWHQQHQPSWQAMSSLAVDLQSELDVLDGLLHF